MQDITQWLQNPDRTYLAGVALFEAHSRNKHLQAQLRRKETRDNWQKLEYELQKLTENEPVLRQLAAQGITFPPGATIVVINSHVAGTEGTGQTREQVHVAPPAPAPSSPLDPAVRARIDELTVQAGNLFKEECQLSNSLHSQPTDAARLVVVDQIEEKKEQRDRLAIERKRLEAGGALEVEQAMPTLPELIRKRDNLRATVSKAKKAVEKARSDSDRIEKDQRLAKVQLQLQEAEMQVKAAQEIARQEGGNDAA